MVKNLPANAGDTRAMGSIPGSGRSPGGGTPVFLPGESHRQRSLASYSLNGLSMPAHTPYYTCMYNRVFQSSQKYAYEKNDA